MKPAVHLQTKAGHQFYMKVWEQFEEAKGLCTVESFKQLLADQRRVAEKSLIEFLNDDTMAKQYKMDDEDATGWQFYKETADQYSVLNHFYNRKVY
jgi:hypothetical protein